MTKTLNGLLTQKPGRYPQQGEIKLFTIEHRKSKNGKPYIKIKNATAEMGGQPYRILSAEQTDFVDQHGNISFSVEVEASSSQPTAFSKARETMQQGEPEEVKRYEHGESGEPDDTTRVYKLSEVLKPPINEPQSPPARLEVATPIDEVRKRLMQAVNLEVLCIRAVDKGIAPHCPEIAHTAEFFQSQVASLFIWATRQGLENKMPETPIQ